MPTTVCEQALINLEWNRSNLDRWWRLLYAFGVAVTIFSILLVIALIWGSAPTRALSGLAAIASGAGVLFVTKNKNAAQKQYDVARKELKPACGSQRRHAQEADAAPGEMSDGIIEILTI